LCDTSMVLSAQRVYSAHATAPRQIVFSGSSSLFCQAARPTSFAFAYPMLQAVLQQYCTCNRACARSKTQHDHQRTFSCPVPLRPLAVRRAELFSLINDLPTCYEVVSGKIKGMLDSAPRKAGPAGGQKKRPRPAVSVARCLQPCGQMRRAAATSTPFCTQQ
jgi:hypothetical protein